MKIKEVPIRTLFTYRMCSKLILSGRFVCGYTCLNFQNDFSGFSTIFLYPSSLLITQLNCLEEY